MTTDKSSEGVVSSLAKAALTLCALRRNAVCLSSHCMIDAKYVINGATRILFDVHIISLDVYLYFLSKRTAISDEK